MIIYNSDLKIFSSTLINDKDYFSGFSTKELGDGNKIGTIINFLHENEINYKTIVSLGQIHSTNIEYVRTQSEELITIEDTDGAVNDQSGVVLSVKTADCLPIVFLDKRKGLIGISHQGWRGSLKRMTVKMVKKLIEIGGNKNEIIVVIGPGIGQCCYDVDDDRYYQFLEEFDGYSDKVFLTRHGKKFLNLTLLNYLQLIEAGIKKEKIDCFPFCTACDKERFFSFRRIKNKELKEMFSFIIRYN